MLGLALAPRSFALVTGSLELERWSVTVISSKSAFHFLIVSGYAWMMLEMIKRYVKRPAVKWLAFVGMGLVAYALANLLGMVKPV